MTKVAIIRPLTLPRWFRGGAHLDDEQTLVYVERARADTYQPLREQKIGLALMRVRTPADVLAFVNRFGLLRTGPKEAEGSVYESVYDFVREADKLRTIWSLLADVRRVVDQDQPNQDRQTALARIQAHGFKDKGLDNLALASNTCAALLARGLGHAQPYVYDRYSVGESLPPGHIRLGIMPDTLIEVCYLQVALALADKEPVDICPECGNPFVVEDARQKFCSAKCGNRARFKRFKQNQTLKTKRKARHVTPRKK